MRAGLQDHGMQCKMDIMASCAKNLDKVKRRADKGIKKIGQRQEVVQFAFG